MTDAIETLRERGLIQDHTDEDALRQHLDSAPRTFYYGVDPSAASLHVGNLVGLMTMVWLQRMGHRPIVLAGGATGRIGDPSFRDEERSLMDEETVERNLAGIRQDFARVLDMSGTVVVDNYEWTKDMTVLEFLRDIGKHFSVNQLISREAVRRRLEDREQGISYTEFSYGLLQAMDYDHLFSAYECTLQIGGSDQWGNLIAGVDLIRRRHGARVHALTWPLIEGSDGKKFSKSAGNAPWLDPEITSPFAYYQWWLNTDDRDVERFLKMFTFLPLDDISDTVKLHHEDPGSRSGQRLLATEATRILHGEDGVRAALEATAVLFGGGSVTDLDDRVLAMAFEQAPTVELSRRELDGGLGLLDLMTRVGASTSNGEARRLIEQGGVRLNDEPVTDSTRTVTPDDLATETTLLLRVGKKRQYLARFT
ncbi:MAG TPA: tyrosine--tRNA ligase [Acidimicrobiia bacterium]|nr:tyrosine--tRNA ligase [Acidimicrobiia bacterium]